MNTPSRPARAGRLLRTSAFAVTLAGVVAVGGALPATAASAATQAPSVSTGAPGTLPPLATGSPDEGRAPGSAPRALPIQPHGGVDTGAGGSQPDARSGADVAVPLAAGGAGLGALAGFGLWRRRRAGALG